MADMLVKLYDVKPDAELLDRLADEGIFIKRCIPPERTIVTDWVAQHFSNRWADECAVSIGKTPPSCFVAYKEGRLLGFACCEATAPNFFGPTGVDENWRGKGIGKALLLAALEHQRAMGYAYSVIGASAPRAVSFYEKFCGAITIPDSSPGIYKDMLGKQ